MDNRPLQKNLLRTALFLFTSLLHLPSVIVSQNPRGTLRGVVQDARGGRIPSAKILARAVESSLQREASTDERGEFRIENLLPGTYHVVASPGDLRKPVRT